MPVNAPVIDTPRLALRELHDSDAAFIVQLLNDPAFLRHIGDRCVRSLDDARAYIAAGPADSYRRYGHGLYLTYLKQSEVPIGICGLVQRDYLDCPDLGFALLPQFRACGYTSEAARGIVDDARARLGLAQLLAITSLDNVASIRLLEKLGFVWQRRMRRPPADEELNVFALAL